MPRIFINLEAGCLQVNLMSTSTQINQLKYTKIYYTILDCIGPDCIGPDCIGLHQTESDRTASDCIRLH